MTTGGWNDATALFGVPGRSHQRQRNGVFFLYAQKHLRDSEGSTYCTLWRHTESHWLTFGEEFWFCCSCLNTYAHVFRTTPAVSCLCAVARKQLAYRLWETPLHQKADSTGPATRLLCVTTTWMGCAAKHTAEAPWIWDELKVYIKFCTDPRW